MARRRWQTGRRRVARARRPCERPPARSPQLAVVRFGLSAKSIAGDASGAASPGALLAAPNSGGGRNSSIPGLVITANDPLSGHADGESDPAALYASALPGVSIAASGGYIAGGGGLAVLPAGSLHTPMYSLAMGATAAAAAAGAGSGGLHPLLAPLVEKRGVSPCDSSRINHVANSQMTQGRDTRRQSSPGPIPAARSARTSASSPLPTPTQCPAPQ